MKYSFKLLLQILCFSSIAISCIPKKEIANNTKQKSVTKVKNIILLIGDGMGLSQVSASQYYHKNKSNFDRFPVIGLTKTSSASELITDSASSATAFASGIKKTVQWYLDNPIWVEGVVSGSYRDWLQKQYS